MSIMDIFYSPELKPYRDLRKKNKGAMGIFVEVRHGKSGQPCQCAMVARNSPELKKIIRELHRIQVIMCVRFTEEGEPADKSRSYLKYSPLDWRFKLEDTSLHNMDTGEELPVTESISL
ncbi:MAG TPA: hypothetical protein PLI62_01765 [Spirochaetota bacterium]|nr:hypothetical protein [Spirochaetota bacterium]